MQYICADSNKSCLLWCCFCFNQSSSKKHLNTLTLKTTCLQFSLENTLKSLCLWQCFLIFLSKIIMTVTRISSCPDSHYNQLFCLYLSSLFFSLPAFSFSHAHSVSYMVKIPDDHNESRKLRCNILTSVVCVCLHVRKCVCVPFPIIHL